MGNNISKTRKLVNLSMMLAVSIVLSIAEGLFPPLPYAVAGVKLGLSNIPVMYTLFFINPLSAFALAVLKSFFVMLTKGLTAGALSLCGGILSVSVMLVLLKIFKEKISYLILSIGGAVFHNIGQLIGVSIIYTSVNIYIYLPVLLIAGLVAGTVTSVLLKVIMPAFKRISGS